MLDNYQNPITTQEDINNLHKVLVQTVIDYIKKYNLTDIDEVNFSVDGLDGDAIEFGEWTPCMDSSLSIVGLQEGEKPFTDKNGNKIPFRVRKIIGESM